MHSHLMRMSNLEPDIMLIIGTIWTSGSSTSLVLVDHLAGIVRVIDSGTDHTPSIQIFSTHTFSAQWPSGSGDTIHATDVLRLTRGLFCSVTAFDGHDTVDPFDPVLALQYVTVTY